MGIKWSGHGPDEKGFDKSGRCIIEVDPSYYRPTEVESLLGDPSKASKTLSWMPKTSFDDLVSEMVANDLKLATIELRNLEYGRNNL